MSRVLGLDPATSCGWALLDNGARVASGTWDLSVKRGESEAMRWIRLERQPCCGKTPFELPRTDRMAESPTLATCGGPAEVAP